MSDILAVASGQISDGLLKDLINAYRGPQVFVGCDRDKILWDQAQLEVVQWIIHKTARKTLTGDGSLLR